MLGDNLENLLNIDESLNTNPYPLLSFLKIKLHKKVFPNLNDFYFYKHNNYPKFLHSKRFFINPELNIFLSLI